MLLQNILSVGIVSADRDQLLDDIRNVVTFDDIQVAVDVLNNPPMLIDHAYNVVIGSDGYGIAVWYL